MVNNHGFLTKNHQKTTKKPKKPIFFENYFGFWGVWGGGWGGFASASVGNASVYTFMFAVAFARTPTAFCFDSVHEVA